MTTKVVKLENFSEELKEYSNVSIENFKKANINALLKALPALVAKSPVDTGLYAQSWDLLIEEKQAIIGNYAPHAPIIEFGARPFVPPIGPLLDWARRVLKQPEINSECWALAKYTQSKIAEEGMQPKRILSDYIDVIINDIKQGLENEFK